MSNICCPVCRSPNHQSFWFWEKEDQRMREWAPDTRVHFSLCRDCALIFQNPLVEKSLDLELGDWNWDAAAGASAEEPWDWLKQFTTVLQHPGRALEIYHKPKRFESTLLQNGWRVKTVRLQDFMQSQKAIDSASKTESEEAVQDESHNGAKESADQNELERAETFDLVLAFDVLGESENPQELLNRLHSRVKENGSLYIEVENPLASPRVKKFCLTSSERCVFPFHTLIFSLYLAGFTNTAAEVGGRIRCVAARTVKNPDANASQLIPRNLWEWVAYRFQRNYYWAWTTSYLDHYLLQVKLQDNALETARAKLQRRLYAPSIIRDVCGACLLFTEETAQLQKSLSTDWPGVMNRIFEVLKNDYALFDLLRLGSLEGLGTFAGIERYYFNDKLIYAVNSEYFQRFFSEIEARRLCETIIQAGKVVCGHLSSFL